MKEHSVKVPALKDLLDRPFDLGCVELMERALRDAGVVNANWSFPWGYVLRDWVSILGDALRSLKRHASSPHRVLDLLCFLEESSDEKMRQTDLDDVTMEDLTAARSALREVIGKVELLVKKGEEIRWNPCQVAPWLQSELRAMDARASMLMTRLEQEAEKENARCLQEVALNSIGILFLIHETRTQILRRILDFDPLVE